METRGHSFSSNQSWSNACCTHCTVAECATSNHHPHHNFRLFPFLIPLPVSLQCQRNDHEYYEFKRSNCCATLYLIDAWRSIHQCIQPSKDSSPLLPLRGPSFKSLRIKVNCRGTLLQTRFVFHKNHLHNSVILFTNLFFISWLLLFCLDTAK